MSEWLIVLIVLAAFAGGYFIMGGIDRFLVRSFRSEPPEYQQQCPSSVMLTDSLSDEELIRSIRHFAAQHDHISIILRNAAFSDAPSHHTGGNPV